MVFNRFRPTSHFIAPHSWMNDPCGAIYIPETKDYILAYQWNPGTAQGGNCAWGMARSKDLVTWEDCSPALKTATSYDFLGVFSGSITSKIIDGRRVLFLFYTSISALPLHWSKTYIKGCESQSVAFSTDFGNSWHRYQNNPIMTTPPKGEGTTGWRDPFVSKWEVLSALLGNNNSTDYMMIASGERGRGPQLHLYKSDNLLDWEPVSTILAVEAGASISSTSKLKFGMNFECASFFSFGDRHYIIVGIEEGHDSKRHSARYPLWLSGNLVLKNGKPIFEIRSHGLLDHGTSYAAHIFRDSEGRLIQLGWADETAKEHVASKQGWAGCLAHPRELYEISKPITRVDGDSDIWATDEASGHMTTLGIRPAPQLSLLRGNIEAASLESFKAISSANYCIEATFRHLSGCEKFVLNVRQSPNSLETTKIIFDLSVGCITVDRSHSSIENLGTSSPDRGFFRLLPDEELHIVVFVDNSIIEIHANDRLALTSRIYPSLETSIGGSYDFGGFEENNVDFCYWEGLKDAWASRKGVENVSEEINSTQDNRGEKIGAEFSGLIMPPALPA